MVESREDEEEIKRQGNEEFKAGQYAKAKELYDKALGMRPDWPAALANRAACEIWLEEHGAAVEDATKALELDPTYVKARYRRASARMHQGRLKEGLKDLQGVVKARPKDPDARRKEAECRKAVQRLRFEQAIAREDDEPAEELDPAKLEVPETYTGPRLGGSEGSTVTEGFVDEMKEAFRKEQHLHKKYALEIVRQAKAVLEQEPSVLDIQVGEERGCAEAINICGDVHGQYYDLLNIFHIKGPPSPDNPFLFNGDFVDRGSFSVEVILTLFAYKVLYPKGMFLTRGNHETRSMNRIYGFEGETKHKYSQGMVNLFAAAFCALPIAALVQGRVLILHGGLFSREGVTLEELSSVDRFREPPEEGVLCEALWSDPQPAPGRWPSKRGVGVAFGPDVTASFCENNGLSYIIRSHEVKDNGYEVAHEGKCITVFSAPNYCDTMGNKGAIITLEPDLVPCFETFTAVPHPPIKPMAYGSPLLNFM